MARQTRGTSGSRREGARRRWWILLLLLLALVVLRRAWWPRPDPEPEPPPVSGEMVVEFLDVGQGDAALVQLPSGKRVLIDGGSRSVGDDLVDALEARGIQQVDLLIGSHPHEDHIGGLKAVLETIAVRAYGDSGYDHGTRTQENLLEALDTHQINARLLHAGQMIGDPSADISVLAPPSEGLDGTESDANNNSVVLSIAFGSRVFLFTGDMEDDERAWLMASGQDLRADVLKVAHHGSHNGTDESFLQAVAPKVAVISCATDNRYGHPHDETLDLLESAGIEVYRTDTMGGIRIVTDGESLDVSSER